MDVWLLLNIYSTLDVPSGVSYEIMTVHSFNLSRKFIGGLGEPRPHVTYR